MRCCPVEQTTADRFRLRFISRTTGQSFRASGRVPITSSLVSIARASCYWYIVEDTNSLSAAVQTNQLQIEGMVYPLNIHLGSGMSLKGLARSTEGAVLTDVEVAILDVMDQVVQSAQAQLPLGCNGTAESRRPEARRGFPPRQRPWRRSPRRARSKAPAGALLRTR